MAKSARVTLSKTANGKVLHLNRKICKVSKRNKLENTIVCPEHSFSLEEITVLRSNLLIWYDSHQRKLPWRDIAKTEEDPDKRGYAVWVSEIMLQQTQVSTVIPYYKKWLEKWPTVKDLATANLEEVNEVWAGLGYYSRAKRLHEGAQIITESLKGCIPQTVNGLMDGIPGIGKYTACAIASVAFQHVVGVVDGNVSRVLSRLRAIGSDISKPAVQKQLWHLADTAVSDTRPGDFNQALMEFGAIVCTPRNPKCEECPVHELCRAYSMSKKSKERSKLFKSSKSKSCEIKGLCDIENVPDCHLCIPAEVWNSNPDVMSFPVKPQKKQSRIENVAVVVVEKDDCLLMVQRPDTGLLAGLWEFPSIPIDEDNSSNCHKLVSDWLNNIGVHGAVTKKLRKVGEVLHIFSHIRTTYLVEHLVLDANPESLGLDQTVKWLTREEISSAAVSTAMKKVLAAVDNTKDKYSTKTNGAKRKCPSTDKNQKSIKAFFK